MVRSNYRRLSEWAEEAGFRIDDVAGYAYVTRHEGMVPDKVDSLGYGFGDFIETVKPAVEVDAARRINEILLSGMPRSFIR